MAPKNRLADETSPYLLQHAENPVEWFPWGEEALEKARAEDKPIFLSIGYAACHWCHVMERESFEDREVAELLRRSFVAIKVDREERPDIDALYMAATVALSGSGGWPMTVFMTPDQKPFFAGTYFPKTARYGRPGLVQLLDRVAEMWRTKRAELLEQAEELTGAVRLEVAKDAPRGVDAEEEDRAAASLLRSFDADWGGFGGAPKFPAPFALSLLLRHHARTGDPASIEAVARTLDRMARGGIYDHVGGGFARYSTDAKWHVPHFEKMLYDNAQLARVYVEAFQVTGDPALRRVAVGTLDYVLREMTSTSGAYFSATDADSEGVEGKYFVWSDAEIRALLGDEDARLLSAAYDVSAGGNWEGANVLWQPRPLAEVARELGVTEEALRARCDASLSRLYEARKGRVPPLLDDKVLTSWNGLMIGAMAFAGRVLGEPRYVESAERAADAVLRDLARPDGGLFRTHRAGRSHIEGFLEDYGFLADALVDTFEASGDRRHLAAALRLCERVIVDFEGGEGEGFYSTSKTAEPLVARLREGQDGATPSANAVAARALVRLAVHADRQDLREAAERAVRAHGRGVARHPRAFSTTLDVVSRLVAPPIEVALVGVRGDEGLANLERVLAKRFIPNLVLAWLDPSAPARALPHPLLEGKALVDGAAAAYVCRAFACALPVTDAAGLRTELDLATARAGQDRARGVTAEGLAGRATEAAARALLARAGISDASTATLGGVPVHRAGVWVTSYREVDAAGVVQAAAERGRNLVAFDAARAAAGGDALAARAGAGGSRAAIFLGALLAPDAADADALRATLARARLAAVDLALVSADPGDLPAARAAGAALASSELTASVGLVFASPLPALVVEALGRADATLSVVACPFNLLEGDAEVLAAARDRGFSLLSLRPLDARSGGRVIQLVDPAKLPQAPQGGPLSAALGVLGALEEEYRTTIASHLRVEGGEVDPGDLLAWSRELGRAEPMIDDIEELSAFVAQSVAPAIGAQMGALSSIEGALAPRVAALRERYLPALDEAIRALGRRIAGRQTALASAVAQAVSPTDPSKLAEIALGAALSGPGVEAALVTTRRAEELAWSDTWAASASDASAAARRAVKA